MALTWSHAVLHVRELPRMLDFYTRALGFEETDRGMIRDGDMEIIFLSQSPREHHQLAFIPVGPNHQIESNPQGDGPPAALAHLAFRVGDLAELRALIATLEQEKVELAPVSHGNTWSVYFQDPEGNGVELFCDTRWHVKQPAGVPWDTELGDDQLRAWTEKTFSGAAGFAPAEEYYARRAVELAEPA